ncbi:hypothetical protein V8F66_23300 (plasmid) [Vreelandella sp. SM1641]|uniref:Carboxypeptidase regulatory-like domain-containing protein n=1 Tax=Vreelandella sp. SM1641 TaxID=3126101 RepID=A0AAU7XUH5_9GAMM
MNGDIRYIAMQFSRLEAFLGAGLTDSGSTQMLAQGHSKRFNINIEQATTLQVTSEHFPGITSTGNRISAVLYNEAGQQVAEASSPRGHFELIRQLQPGNYQLEVSGSSLGGNNQSDSNRYELHVAY